jgi:hypothetical protein
MVASPAPIAATTPVWVTVATAFVSDDQAAATGLVVPSLSVSSAWSCGAVPM